MSSSWPRRFRGVAARSFTVCALLTLVLFAGCSPVPTGETQGPWPTEAQDVTPLAGDSVATVMPRADASVFAAGQTWLLSEEGFTAEATFSEDYRPVRDRAAVSGVPYLGGAQAVGPRALFALRGEEVVSDGQGVEQIESYDDLLLLDPDDPANRDSVYRVPGVIDSARTHESSNGEVALIALEWSSANSRVLTLLSRSDGGMWERIWSSDQRESDKPWVPMAFGFTSAPGPDQVSLVVAGDGDELPELGDPSVLLVDAAGDEVAVQIDMPDDLQSMDTLNAFADGEGVGVAFRYRTDESVGVVVTAPGGEDVGVRELQGEPLHVLGDGESLSVLVGPLGVDSGPLDLVDLEDGSSVRLLAESDAKWARELKPANDQAWRLALLGRRLESDEQAAWSITEVSFQNGSNDAETSVLLDSWRTSARFGGVSSLDELVADEGGRNHLVLGMQTGNEGALATLPVE